MLSIKRNTKESKKIGRTIALPKSLSRLHNLDNELTKNLSKGINPKDPYWWNNSRDNDFLHTLSHPFSFITSSKVFSSSSVRTMSSSFLWEDLKIFLRSSRSLRRAFLVKALIPETSSGISSMPSETNSPTAKPTCSPASWMTRMEPVKMADARMIFTIFFPYSLYNSLCSRFPFFIAIFITTPIFFYHYIFIHF